VIGKAFVVGASVVSVREHELPPGQIDGEIARFRSALQRSRQELEALREQARDQGNQDLVDILEMQVMVIDDGMLEEEVTDRIRKTRRNSGFALKTYVDEFCDQLAKAGNDFFAERSNDIQDLAGRILRKLLGGESVDLSVLPEPCVLIAHDLSPSDTAGMDRANVLAFVTGMGSRTSHTAIMARALGIPAVVGVGDPLGEVKDGAPLIVDGNHGLVVLDPNEETLADYLQRIEQEKAWRAKLEANALLPAETRDGFHVSVAANVELPEEVERIRRVHRVGIGLFRTEFLFVQGGSISDEELQYEAYRRVAEDVAPHSVIFRTLDIGGDKFLSHLDVPVEINPFLGMRAIRFCLQREDIFRSQLRAILRASAHGGVRVLFPMITTMEELMATLRILEETKAELASKGIAHNPDLDVGIMIEVPAAAMIADMLAPHVDFFSIGTNDLVQYTMAVDRSNPDISYLYQPGHPSIIRLLDRVVRAANEHGRWVGICGEMAAEPLFVPLILGLGIHELSMSPVAIPVVKDLVRDINMLEAEELVDRAMACGSAEEVTKLCREFVERVSPELFMN
jgi:phosphotransferase system enzyme I (PtsI)